MKHKWNSKQQGGDPTDLGSYEWVTFCENCGVEMTDDNEHDECTD